MAEAKLGRKEWFYFIAVIALYIVAVWYVAAHNLSWSAMFKAGILQEKGITGMEARVKEINTPLSGIYFFYPRLHPRYTLFL